MSKNSLILVLQNKQENSTIDMAKIHIKSLAPVLTYNDQLQASNWRSKALNNYNSQCNIVITMISAPVLTYTPKYFLELNRKKHALIHDK